MRKHWVSVFLAVLLLSVMGIAPVAAEGAQPPVATPQGLSIFTTYPSQVVGIGEHLNYDLKIHTESVEGEIVTLGVEDLPEGWTATFRGAGKVIQSVYVRSDEDVSLTLRVEPPAEVDAGTYAFRITAQGASGLASFPLEAIVKAKMPPRLSLSSELPTLKGSPATTFRYSATLKNEGDEDLSVNLSADAPAGFTVNFKLSGQDVTSLPLDANSTKRLSIEVKPLDSVSAGTYPIQILAQGGSAQATLDLTAEVTGQPQLSITTQDGRLSAQANAGKETPLKIIIRNNGTAPAREVELKDTAPNGWKLSFDPQKIDEIPAGQQAEVTVNMQPPEKAIAGDYVITLRARPADGVMKSADFRITVTTSTLWGLTGVFLIAIAVAVVALAVVRFGRR
jgi:uncharacterized repeat protein (TIGR01451 family)